MSSPVIPQQAATLRLSVITSTLNSETHIGQLISDLEQQTDRDFEWVVADGGSQDATVDVIRSRFPHAIISQQPDFGIYDAINRGIRTASGDYYLVIGSDDRLAPDAIARYRAEARASDADIVTASVIMAGKVVTARPGQQALHGIRAFVSGHSVGALIRRQLHQRVGYYSGRFPICADHLFFQRAARAGARIHISDFVAGEFTLDGLSGTDVAGILCENYRIGLMSGGNRLLLTALLLLRLLKNFKRL